MPCALSQGYNLDCRFNFGGVREIYVIEFENVTAITESAGVISAITKASTKTFKKYNLIAHLFRRNVINGRLDAVFCRINPELLQYPFLR